MSAFPVQTVYASGHTEDVPVVDPVHSSDGYAAVLYNNTNGLPTSEANAIARTNDGFIWIGSYSGLVRYDGNTFERVDSTTGIASVICLFVDSKDRLWIGMSDNGLAMMEPGKLHIWGKEDGLSDTKVNTIAEDGDGNIYAGTTSGMTMFTPDLEISPIKDTNLSMLYFEMMKLGSDGLLYCMTNEDDFFTVRDGQLVDYIDHTQTHIQGITSILPDPDDPGMLYVGTESSDFYYGDWKRAGEGQMKATDISPLFNVIDARQIGNQIWLYANNGVGVIEDGKFYYLDKLPMNNSVTDVMVDYEGNMWFASSRQGVMKVVANKFHDVFGYYGLPEQVVNSTCMYDDKLFVATDTGLIVLDENGIVPKIPLTEARTASGKEIAEKDLVKWLDDCRIRSILRDSKGRLWISTWRSNGLIRYDQGKATAFTEEDGLPSNHIRAVSETADDVMLVAVTGGACVIEGDKVTACYNGLKGVQNLETLTVCGAPNGDLLMGSNGGGIYVASWKGVRNIRKENGLSSGIIMRIKYDAANHVFWIVTSNSIAYMTEDYKVTTVKEFPYSNNFDLYQNSKGDMWVLSSNGIYVVPTEELLANKEIKPVFYGIVNGLPCMTTANSYSDVTPEGDLYIAGNSGVARVNIEEPLEEIRNLKQAVPFIDADDVRLYPDEKGAFRLTSDVQKVTVHGFVYNYSLTEPMVSYQLRGFDKGSVTVSRSELGPVTYTNLPGGSYVFEMDLTDAMGRGSNILSVPIVKEKALYEQAWFYCIAIMAAGLAIALLVQSYVRRRMLALEAEHKAKAEQERISNELQMANQIQLAMLPHDFPPFPDRKEFDIFASMNPAREVGGDFYDFFLIDDDHLCLVMADVSGKGIPAALYMMISKTLLKSFTALSPSSGDILTKVNNTLSRDNKADMFVTVWIGILEISTGRLVAANAGHEYPVIKRADGAYELYKDRHGLVLGGMEGLKYREYELYLSAGDKLFLYTDGVPEATAADNAMFGTERMLEALNKEPDAAPQQVLKNVRQAVDAFVGGAEQFDDLTMMCVEYRG